MTEAERDICKIYLEDLADLNKSHSCNEYKMLMGMLNFEPCKDTIRRQAAIELCREKLIDMKANPDFYDDAISHYGGSRYNDGVNTCIDVIEELPPAQSELDTEALVHMIETGIIATNSMDVYSLGMRNGMRWCKSLIDNVEPKFEKFEADMRGEKNE